MYGDDWDEGGPSSFVTSDRMLAWLSRWRRFSAYKNVHIEVVTSMLVLNVKIAMFVVMLQQEESPMSGAEKLRDQFDQ